MTQSSLSAVSNSLRRQLPVNAMFTSVNTRLIIQTGVNLKRITPEQDGDPALVNQVVDALARMGIEVSP